MNKYQSEPNAMAILLPILRALELRYDDFPADPLAAGERAEVAVQNCTRSIRRDERILAEREAAAAPQTGRGS